MTDASRTPPAVPVLDRAELRARLAADNPPKLVMVASDFGFRAKHIPGSIHVHKQGEGFEQLDKDDDIIVYCSDIGCRASSAAIQIFLQRGFSKISHYAGGLID